MTSIGFENKLDKSIIEYDAEMKNYSTFGIGGKVLAVLKPRTKIELIDCILECKRLNKKFQVIGNGSNILFNSSSTKRVFITTKFIENEFKAKENIVSVSSGMMFSEFIVLCIERGFSGLEELYGIPATIGGMVIMNAGAFNKQIFDYLTEIEIFDGTEIKTIPKEQIKYSHHCTELLKTNKIILSATFKLERLAQSVIKSKCRDFVFKRNEKQPKGKSAGSVFRSTKDNVPAGYLIDMAGLKGLCVNDAVVSEKHANFIINKSFATDEDVKSLIKIIKQKIKEKYNVRLEREIEYIGDRDGYYR